MNASISLCFHALLTLVCAAGQPHEYLRVNQEQIPFFAPLAEVALPELKPGTETSGKLDVTRIRQAVFDLVVVTKDAHEVVKVAASATAFAVQAGDEVLLAGSYHALGNSSEPLTQFAVLAKGSDDVWFHVEKFHGVSAKTDFVLMKPPRALQASFAIAPEEPKPLDTLYTCGRLGRFSGAFRKGEMMKEEQSFFLASLAVAQGSSGSPVFNDKGLLVGMVTEVIPILRESGLYSGDHFAEHVITKCRPFR